MSNLTKLNKFKLISSPEFIEILQNAELPIEEHNFLLATHILAIAYNSTGLHEGSFTLRYIIHLDFNSKLEDQKPQPEPNFAFYTTQNGLIEKNKKGNYALKIKNKQFPQFSNSFTFKKFFIEYFNQHSKNKNLDNYISQFSIDNRLSFRLEPKQRFKEIEQMKGYTTLIGNNPIMDKFLNFYELHSTLKPQTTLIKKAKI